MMTGLSGIANRAKVVFLPGERPRAPGGGVKMTTLKTITLAAIAANRCGVSAIVYSQPQCRRRKKGGRQRHGMSCFHFVAPSDDRPIGRSPAQQKPSRAGVEAFVIVSSIYFWNINRSVEPNKMI
jgi:hypothetical protein